MLSKILILAVLAGIVYSLVSAFWFLIKDKGESDRTVWRLTWRVGLSLGLLLMMYLMFLAGWIQPSGGPVGRTIQGDRGATMAEPAGD